MPSTRKQKAKEKRTRQSDVIQNKDVMLGCYPRNQLDEDLEDENVEIDSRSNGLSQETNSKIRI